MTYKPKPKLLMSKQALTQDIVCLCKTHIKFQGNAAFFSFDVGCNCLTKFFKSDIFVFITSTSVRRRWTEMTGEQGKLVIVSSEVLPEIIMKVLIAKGMRARGEAATSAEACRAVGISRSAYYKYKDCVFNYDEQLTNNILSIYLILHDEKGVLSSIIAKLYELGTNIITINQNIPVDSVATVTVSVRLDQGALSAAQLRQELGKVSGVVDVKLISGE